MCFFVPSVGPCMHHNYGVILGRCACKDCMWPISLVAGLCTTCRSEQVLVAIRFNATFLRLRPYREKCVGYLFLEQCKKSKNVWLRDLMQSDFDFRPWTLQLHFTSWLSARALQCYFEDVCRPQRICTLPGLSLGWTLFLNMLFSCPTLDVLMYQVSQVSEQLCQQYVCNVVLYEVSRVGKQVSVLLWHYHQRRYKTFCVLYYQSVLCR